jgi:hypothetical protein
MYVCMYVCIKGGPKKNSSCAATFGDLYKDEMGRSCSTNGETRNAYRILVGKIE